ncbi:recombination protein F [Nodularia spumigena CENA596]|uniref:Recombination protein F n=1 Tax=Nodularia spumigena CENA596 TaxID=1819295 RepID=A0A166I0S6_NODSP|nr:recombination protein F [Nodularia spumigena CENA596]
MGKIRGRGAGSREQGAGSREQGGEDGNFPMTNDQ